LVLALNSGDKSEVNEDQFGSRLVVRPHQVARVRVRMEEAGLCTRKGGNYINVPIYISSYIYLCRYLYIYACVFVCVHMGI